MNMMNQGMNMNNMMNQGMNMNNNMMNQGMNMNNMMNNNFNQGNGMMNIGGNINNNMMMNMMMNNINQMNNILMGMIAEKNINNNNNYNNNQFQQENNNNETNNNNDLNEIGNQITLVFRRNKKEDNIDFTIKIICKSDELVKDVLERYCFKTNENKTDLLFLFNTKELKEDITIQNAGIINMSIIFVIDAKGIIGGK